MFFCVGAMTKYENKMYYKAKRNTQKLSQSTNVSSIS